MESAVKHLSVPVKTKSGDKNIEVDYFVTDFYGEQSNKGYINVIARVYDPEKVDIRDVMPIEKIEDEEGILNRVKYMTKEYFSEIKKS